MKTIYLVRHGETNANVKKTWQNAFDELSERGVVQAENLANRLQNVPFDYVVSSSMKRAVQTVEAVCEKNGLPYVQSDLFVEVSVPTSTIGSVYVEVVGNPGFDYVTARDAEATNPDFRYEDEETLHELLSRIQSGLDYLDHLPAENILVVTHGTILRTLVSAVMHQGLDVSPYTIFTAGRRLDTVNTSITVLHKPENGLWSIFTYNDHAHFAE
ncbi:MAG: histidine phosphatase family protein [Patescibacteria group bacterium]